MGIVKRAGDLVYTFRFLKLLVTDFKDTEAFKLGLIDDKGKKLKKADSSEERSAYTPFHRLVFNIKKLIPAGKVGSYLSALFLIKEQFGISDKLIKEGLEHYGVDQLDLLNESTQWFLLEDKRLTPGSYRLSSDKIINSTMEELARANDFIEVNEDCYPIGDLFGVDVYEVLHKRSRQKVYVTVKELRI